MVLVYLYIPSTRTFNKGRLFLKTKLQQAAFTRHVTTPTYSSTLFALLLHPLVNVSDCLVREREREGIKYGTGILVQFEHTNV